MTHHSYSWAMSAHWDRLAAVFALIDSLNHASGQSYKAYPVLGSVSYHWWRAICQPPWLWGRSGMHTPASGIVFTSEMELAGEYIAPRVASALALLGEVHVMVCSGCSVFGVHIEVIGFRTESVFNWEHVVGGLFKADMIVVPNMQNSWTVTGCKSVLSPMKLWSGSFCTRQSTLP